MVGLVEGVTLLLAPGIGTSFAVAGMTSARGRSHTFDARADGYARGEACGGVALRVGVDGSAVRLPGSAVRQDGRSASLTAPNGQAQQGLLVAVLRDAVTPVGALTLNEAHGTGTALGDPIEAGSLAAAVLAPRGEAPLAVGGVKANIGHAEPAAGLTGLLKLTLGLQGSEAASNAQLRLLNPHVGGVLCEEACVLPMQLATSLGGEEPRGGVSSFGYSGTIAHVLVASCSGSTGEVLDVSLCTFNRPAFAPRRNLLAWYERPHPFAQRRLPSSDDTHILHSACNGALRSLVANHVRLPPLAYRRRAFPWCDVPSTVVTPPKPVYSICWTRIPPAPADTSCACLLLTMQSWRNPDDTSVASDAWRTVAAVLPAAGTAAPSLHGMHLDLAFAQQLAGHARPLRMLMLTCGTLAVGGTSGAAHGGVWGFARVLRLEHVVLRMQSIELPSHGAFMMAHLALALPHTEAEVSWRATECFGARLSACSAVPTTSAPLARGVYAITGGLGGSGCALPRC
jgi:hypothetical protein